MAARHRRACGVVAGGVWRCGAIFRSARSAALATLLRGPARDPDLREALRRRAVARLVHYTWTANAQIVLAEIRAQLGPLTTSCA